MIQVTENLFGGPRPKTLHELLDAGFKFVIDFESGAYDIFNNDIYECEAKSSPSVIRIPCSDVTPPSQFAVQQFLYYVTRYSADKCYIHCLSGVDRTGFMIAVYRMRMQKWSFKQAQTEWVSNGRHWWYWWWKYELKKYGNKNE